MNSHPLPACELNPILSVRPWKPALLRAWRLLLLLCGLASASAQAQPAFTEQPTNTTAVLGSTVTFHVGATGAEPLTYQWRSYSTFATFTNIPWGTAATLVLTNATLLNHAFAAIVTDASGHFATSSLARLTLVTTPSVATEPGDQNAVVGEHAALTVVSAGTGPLGYQWYFNGQPSAEATLSSLVFTNVQFSDAGAYQVVISNHFGAATSRVARLTVVPTTPFVRVTNGPVATDLGQCTGCVWADFNNDGFLDLFVAQYFGPTNHFYTNNGDGTFTRVERKEFEGTGEYNLGVSAADYDNDGSLDLIIAAGGGAPIGRRTALLHNNGDGTFSRENAGGITNQLGFFWAAEWADYDNDGFADVLILDEGNTSGTGAKPLLWHNSGDGTFSRVTNGSPVSEIGDGVSLTWSDYDNDGRVDLLILNGTAYSTNYLYHNLGGGKFERVLAGPIVSNVVHGTTGSEGGDWGDYDNDGLQDLLIVDFNNNRSHLYHNNGGGSFSDVDAGAMLAAADNAHVGAWGDYDNDGYLDVLMSYWNHHALFRNNHDGTFTEIRSSALSSNVLVAPNFFNTPAWVDYDNDGFLDFFVTVGNNNSTQTSRNLLYHNSGNSNSWLEVKCIGTVGNRSAIGAKIRAQAVVDGKTIWQLRELRSGSGWDLAKPLVAHFGLGNATNVETLRIEWPSGTVQELRNVASRQILTVIEPPRLTAGQTNGHPQFALRGGRKMSYDIEASANLVTWSRTTNVTVTEMNGIVALADPTPAAGHRFYRAVAR